MNVFDWLFGRTLANDEDKREKIGLLEGIPVLGLDALSSAAYGPEAALTLLIPLGAMGLRWVGPISALIIGILIIVCFSYHQTIAAYPQGGGSYTVAKENLGYNAALLAAAALALDYILNVAVGISAGVGALVSAVPALMPHMTALCIAMLIILTLVNLRGVKEAGITFMLPTYAFVGTLGCVIIAGAFHAIASHGHPMPVAAPPAIPAAIKVAGLWILMRAFASGCTAMTGVEAVSNGVPIFRDPAAPTAQRTLTAIIVILIALLAGIAYLAHAYGIVATTPGQPGYQSILSMLVAAVFGRGVFYYATMTSIVAVLALSANTSFADFPRLCHILAQDRFLPGSFIGRGRRLVFSHGIIWLAILSGALLIFFGGVTDRLIPLFAIGAFLAFTLSQTGMVVHWRRTGGEHAKTFINAAGAAATAITLVVVAVSKFSQGAWLTLIALPILVMIFLRINRHYQRVAAQIATTMPLEIPAPQNPIVVLSAGSWNKMTQNGLKFALRLSAEIYMVQVRTEQDNIDNLADNWQTLIGDPARQAGIPEPKLVVLTSGYRRFFRPFVDFVHGLELKNPGRDVVVIIPDLVMCKWYENILHNNRGAMLRALLRVQCGPQVVTVDTPFHLEA